MAKASDKNPVVSDVAPLPGQTAIPGTNPAPVAPAAKTAEELRAMGDAFLKAHEKALAAKAAFEAARVVKSDTIKVIVEALGHKGPFNIGGKLFSASQSKSTGMYSMGEESGAKATL